MSDCCPTCGQSLLGVAGPQFDHEIGAVIANGRAACLTRQEADLFAALKDAAPRTLAKNEIIARMYTHDADEPDHKIVDVFVCKINHKLRGLGIHIANVWGRGYRLVFHERTDSKRPGRAA